MLTRNKTLIVLTFTLKNRVKVIHRTQGSCFQHPSNDPQVIMHSLITLEKFAQTSENRLTICRRLRQYPQHPLVVSFLLFLLLCFRNVSYCVQLLVPVFFSLVLPIASEYLVVDF